MATATDRIAFNTANLVARESGYRFKLSEWGKQDALTRERTTEQTWEAICDEVAGAGYRAVEVWAAHVDPPRMTAERCRTFRRILDDHGLTPIGLAGPLTTDTARVCRALGIPACNGGFWGTSRQAVVEQIQATGLAANYENHPEKSVEEIRAQVAGTPIGLAVDTGWLGTQGIDAPAAIRALGGAVTHVHLKDVRAAGGHETCPLGQGVVNCSGVIDALRDIGYAGWYSWEDEPEDRNPMDIAAAMRHWIAGELTRAGAK